MKKTLDIADFRYLISNMQKKAFIFDFDGTLAETFPIIFKAMAIAYDRLGLQAPTRETVYANFGPHELGLLKRLNPENAQELFNEYLKASAELIEAEGLYAFDGIKELLAELKERGVKIALITGKSKESLELTLEAIGLYEYFDILKWGGETGSIKPQRLREVLEQLQIAPSQAIYIGDSTQDILDCNEVGVDILSAAWARCVELIELEKLEPKAVLKNVSDVLKFC